MRRLRTAGHKVFVTLCIANFTTAHSSYELFARAAACPDPSYVHCNAAGLPADFCCPSTTTCIPLAANTTLLCCPSGGDCSQIQPITCDITQQNATLHPDNQLKTSDLTTALPTCAGLCCPFGYSCANNSTCTKNTDQDVAPGGSASSSSTSSPNTTPTPTSSSSQSTTTSTSSPANGNTTLHITETCNRFPAAAVLVGFFPGLISGILLSMAGICIFGAQLQRSARRRSSASFGNISEPQPSSHTRTDFLRAKQPQTPSSTAGSMPTRQGTVHRVRSLFRKSAFSPDYSMEQSPRPPMPLTINKRNGNGNGNGNGQNQRPVTPPLQRERSYEDVNIFADQDTASSLRENERNLPIGLQPGIVDNRASHQTTMSDVMGLAGLPKGQPYVYKGNSPGFTPSPKSRGS